MTITLGWWAIPLAIILIGWIWAWIDTRNDSGMFAGMFGALIFLGSLITAAAVTLGHFL